MNRQSFVLVMIVLALAAAPARSQKPTAESLFREGLMKERAEGKLREAIFRYERVIAEFPREREVVARALFQLSVAYEKLGDPRATVMLTRLAAGPASQPLAGRARAKLLAMQAAAASGPFPQRDLDKDLVAGSPDGRYAVLYRGEDMTKLYLRELDSGRERLLLDQGGFVSNFAWSPDSSRLAYNFMDSGQFRELRVVRISNGEISNFNIRGWPHYWTATDEIIFYRVDYAGGGINHYAVPAAGGAERKVYTDAGGMTSPAFTPDLRSVVVVKNEKLVLVNLSTGEERNITATGGKEGRPAVSLDGRLVAFAANLDGQWAYYAARLDAGFPIRNPVKLGNVNSASPRRGEMGFWWTHDGMLSFRIEHTGANIYRIEMDPRTGRATDAPLRLTQDSPRNTHPSISPDGKHIAYFGAYFGGQGLSVMKSDGAHERPLVPAGGTLPLHWRSLEEVLFYDFRPRAEGKTRISSINIQTGVVQDFAQPEGLYWRYVPGTQEVFHIYAGGGGARPGSTLKALSLADMKERVALRVDNLTPFFTLTGDGRRLAYGVRQPAGGTARFTAELWMISGETRTLLANSPDQYVSPEAWSPDGKFLLYTERPSGPRIINVETKESWPLHAETSDEKWGGGSWSPDGRFVAVTRSTRRTERLAWTGLTADAVARLSQGVEAARQ